jgi:YidC/Oxa1 family membrane protein insertase
MIKRFLFWFLIFFSIFFFIESFNQKPSETIDMPENVFITTDHSTYGKDQFVIATIHNNRDTAVTIPWDCPNEPLSVFLHGQIRQQVTAVAQNIECPETEIIIEPKETHTFTYAPWNRTLFEKPGTYEIQLTLQTSENTTPDTASKIFEIKSRGFFGTIWNEGLYRPIFNVLIAIAAFLPGHNFGWSIIILTLIIRLILLVPNQKALRSQREMQKIQPELEAIKRKNAGNQEVIAKKTMELWKSHKINPASSCLPILVQLPILIALFYVAQNSLHPYNEYLLYGGLKSFDLTLIDTNFLWMNLAHIDRFILPIVVGLLQFGQMKLVTAGIKKNQHGEEKKGGMQDMMHNMNKVMTYVMPVMIAIMTASFPAGVGLYWGFSTVFGIGQQLAVNKEKKGKKKKSDDDSVKIIDVTPQEGDHPKS